MCKIMLTNDDGIFTDGMERLARTASEVGGVDCCTGFREERQSLMQHHFTCGFEAWEVDYPIPGVKSICVQEHQLTV